MNDIYYIFKFIANYARIIPGSTNYRKKIIRFSHLLQNQKHIVFDFDIITLYRQILPFMRKPLVISLGTIFILSGCGIFGGTSEPGPISLKLTISASKKLNPDIEKRASPIVIRIYQLTQIDRFNNSDFFALYENDQSILAKDLKYREELEIQPGQSTTKTLEISSNSKYIAVLAAYRDLDKAQWKSFLEINPINLHPIKIEVGESAIILKIADSKD